MSPKGKRDAAEQVQHNVQRAAGISAIASHPIFEPLARRTWERVSQSCPADGWAIVKSSGEILLHPTRLAEPAEWSYVYAHCLLHLGFGHFKEQRYHEREWNAACDCYIAQFLADLRIGTPPKELNGLLDELQRQHYPIRSEEQLFTSFCERGLPPSLFPTGTAGSSSSDMLLPPTPEMSRGANVNWQEIFAHGLAMAAGTAVNVAGGTLLNMYDKSNGVITQAQQARSWFISTFPLLGALAASFTLIEDAQICQRLDIRIAAVCMERRELYMNPQVGLENSEVRFVMAHELLHAGLRHDVRCNGRDPYLWNVACDYVVNQWLIEMDVGKMPAIGGLYDPELKGESAEAIYDRITGDLRRYRKLGTFAGFERSDILDAPSWWERGGGIELDEFYRNCLTQGLLLHQQQERGYISAELIEEIQALNQPPIPWDVQLAQWFDQYFPPLEQRRTYARLSRRQSSTPDIPRPLWVPIDPDEEYTFGVVLDTSGSMDRTILAKALGAIASYSIARDVRAVRVVFCDSAAFDQGYMAPEDIAGNVKVKGRGGTVLQPGVDLLEQASDFPAQGPLLFITDGFCDNVRIRRDHAFLLPQGRSLPFRAYGPVFFIQ